MTWPDVATHLSPSVVESFEKDMYTMYIVKKYMIQYFWSPLLLFFGCRIFFLCHRFLKIGFAQWVIHIFKIMQKIILYTVFAQIRGRRPIKALKFSRWWANGFFLDFCPNLHYFYSIFNSL